MIIMVMLRIRGGAYVDVQFRVATSDDIVGIIDLCNKCFNEHTDLDYAREIYEENKSDRNQIYLIGILDNEIIYH